ARDCVLGVVPLSARCARWLRAGVVRSCRRQIGTRSQRAEHAHAADRCAREILGFLTVCVARLRRLMGNPLGGSHSRLCMLTISTQMVYFCPFRLKERT